MKIINPDSEQMKTWGSLNNKWLTWRAKSLPQNVVGAKSSRETEWLGGRESHWLLQKDKLSYVSGSGQAWAGTREKVGQC